MPSPTVFPGDILYVRTGYAPKRKRPHASPDSGQADLDWEPMAPRRIKRSVHAYLLSPYRSDQREIHTSGGSVFHTPFRESIRWFIALFPSFFATGPHLLLAITRFIEYCYVYEPEWGRSFRFQKLHRCVFSWRVSRHSRLTYVPSDTLPPIMAVEHREHIFCLCRPHWRHNLKIHSELRRNRCRCLEEPHRDFTPMDC